MRHKHADLICAWANGAKIQYYDAIMCRWSDNENPKWYEAIKFRVKPEPKPDVEFRYTVNSRFLCKEFLCKECDSWEKPNLNLTFDGETGELKSAEVLK